MQHLGLTRQAVAAVDRDRPVGGIVLPGLGRAAGEDGLLHPTEQRVGNHRSRRGLLGDADRLRCQQVLELLGTRQPDRQQLVHAVEKLRILAPLRRHRGRRPGQRLPPAGPQACRGMHEQHPHVSHAPEQLETPHLLQRERLQAGHEQSFPRRPVVEAQSGRWGRTADLLPHRPPELELPVIRVAKLAGHGHAVLLFVVGRRAQHPVGPLAFPFQDHPRPANVIVVKQAGNPPRGEQGLAHHGKRDAQAGRGRARDQVEHREGEPIERPGIDRLRGPWWLQQRDDRAGIGDIDVGHDAVVPA